MESRRGSVLAGSAFCSHVASPARVLLLRPRSQPLELIPVPWGLSVTRELGVEELHGEHSVLSLLLYKVAFDFSWRCVWLPPPRTLCSAPLVGLSCASATPSSLLSSAAVPVASWLSFSGVGLSGLRPLHCLPHVKISLSVSPEKQDKTPLLGLWL